MTTSKVGYFVEFLTSFTSEFREHLGRVLTVIPAPTSDISERRRRSVRGRAGTRSHRSSIRAAAVGAGDPAGTTNAVTDVPRTGSSGATAATALTRGSAARAASTSASSTRWPRRLTCRSFRPVIS